MIKFNWKRMLLNGVLRIFGRRRFRNSYKVSFILKMFSKLEPALKLPSNFEHRLEAIVDIDCEWFTPAGIGDEAPLLLYFPGGGFVLPALNEHRKMIIEMCQENQCRAVLAQYRLGPEHRLPTGHQDGLNIYRFLLEERDENPDTIFVMGDSAGGGVALSTLLQARDSGLPLPAGAMLLSAWTDLTLGGDSMIDNLNKDPLFHISALLWMLNNCVPEDHTPSDPLVSPAHGDFSNLPPLLLEVGSTELLLDSSTTVAQRARDQQVEVELTISPYSPHIYPILGFLPEAKAARNRMSKFIEQHRGTFSGESQAR